jgi:hypothetical protein
MRDEWCALLDGHSQSVVLIFDRIFEAKAIAHQSVSVRGPERLKRTDAIAPIAACPHVMDKLRQADILLGSGVDHRIRLDWCS